VDAARPVLATDPFGPQPVAATASAVPPVA
jgi:hypothetical protein